MRRLLCTTTIALAFLTAAERLPAPIVEEEKATPAPATEQAEAPKKKHSKKSTSTAEQSPSPQSETKKKPAPVMSGPARFAGTWTGKVNQGLLGHVETSFTIDPTGASVELSENLGGGSKKVTTNGNSITWKSGVAGEITWTLTPNSDGQTAQVTMKGLMLKDTMTFHKGR